MKEQLAKILGLDPEASDEAFVEAVAALADAAGRTKEAEATSAEMEQRATKAESQLLAAQVDRDLADFAHCYPNTAEGKDAARKALMSNRDATIAGWSLVPKGGALPNRTDGKLPADEPGAKQSTEAVAMATAIRNRANEIRRTTPGTTFSQAWTLAERELSKSEK